MDWLLIALSVALHELAHSATAALFGAPTRAVVIGMPPIWRRIGRLGGVDLAVGKVPLGFAVDIDDAGYAAMRRWQLVVVCLAGVVVNVALAFPFWAAGYHYAAITSFVLGVANALPMPPLDGGMALLAVLGTSPERRARLASAGNRVLIVVTAVFGLAALILSLA